MFCYYVHCTGEAAIYAMSPQNVTAAVRSSPIFSCKTDSAMPIRWNRIVLDQLLPINIYNGYSVTRKLLFKYSVRDNVSVGLGELEVTNVGLLDSGTYACQQLNSSVNNVMFHLTVVGKPFPGLLLCTSVKCLLYQRCRKHFVVGRIKVTAA